MHAKWIFLSTLLAATGLAQDKVNIPLSKPGQPVTLHIRTTNTNVTLRGSTGKEVTVESAPSKTPAKPRRSGSIPPGMHRIDVGQLGLDIEEKDNDITLRDTNNTGSNIVITVPVNSTVITKTNNCRFIVEGLEGNLEIDNSNGSINLTKISGAVVVHNRNGSIRAELAKVAPDQPLSFTTLNGQIDVTLPAATKAKLKLKADNGSIYSDFEMKLEAGAKPEVSDNRTKDGLYKVRMDRSVTAFINGGGPEYLFQSMNGSILIRKK
jgi:hypothetical protein